MITYELTLRFDATNDNQAMQIGSHVERETTRGIIALFGDAEPDEPAILNQVVKLRIERLTRIIVTRMEVPRQSRGET